MTQIRKIFEHAQELSGRMIVRGVNIGPLPVNEAMALVIRTLDEERDRIEELEAKHTELVSAVKDLLHDVKYSLLDEGLSDVEGYELWEEVRKFRRVVCAAGLAELKGQNDE